jgi:hypothetical protein
MTKKQGTSKYSPHSSSSLRSRQGKPNQKRLPKWRPLNSDAVVDLEHHFYDSLKLLLDDDERSRLERIRPIYWRIVEEIRRRKNEFKFPDFVRQEDFEAAVKEQGLDEFFDLLKKAVDTRKKSDVMALLTDGTCSYYRANPVMNVLQVDFGSLHPRLLMVLTNQAR